MNPKDFDITYGDEKLWGIAGGELEYVSQRLEWVLNEVTGRYHPVMVIRFTDHDQNHGYSTNGLIEGKYYELSFRLADT